MKFILGKKLEMTQVWKDGKKKSVTKIQAGPCIVTQVKTEKTDGYNGVQVGLSGKRREKNIKKPQIGHLKKVRETGAEINFEYLREFRLTEEEIAQLSIGDILNIETFEEGEKVNITGVSKGKGFQGVVKRHGFKGSKKTHGNKDQLRMPGSIGATGPAHVFKGTRMGGRMGTDRVTTTNIEVVEVDTENNFILINGSVPGARNSLVMLKCKGDLKITKREEKKEIKEEKKEEVKAEVKEEKKEEVKAEEKSDNKKE